VLILAVCMLGGCTDKPVRHLASDAGLISAGKTSRDEVLRLLGEPDTQQMVGDDVEKWVYYQEDPSFFQKTPVVGEMVFDSKGYKMIVLLLKGDLVTSCKYSAYSNDDYKWEDDFSWQEKN